MRVLLLSIWNALSFNPLKWQFSLPLLPAPPLHPLPLPIPLPLPLVLPLPPLKNLLGPQKRRRKKRKGTRKGTRKKARKTARSPNNKTPPQTNNQHQQLLKSNKRRSKNKPSSRNNKLHRNKPKHRSNPSSRNKNNNQKHHRKQSFRTKTLLHHPLQQIFQTQTLALPLLPLPLVSTPTPSPKISLLVFHRLLTIWKGESREWRSLWHELKRFCCDWNKRKKRVWLLCRIASRSESSLF
mmetsp:Transcript_32130/g.50295  ORF Transcript_32130/g.50295 Transcript_32130/m.50295 type:complete len:239 (-) Transcript_32130:1156-1872(-)